MLSPILTETLHLIARATFSTPQARAEGSQSLFNSTEDGWSGNDAKIERPAGRFHNAAQKREQLLGDKVRPARGHRGMLRKRTIRAGIIVGELHDSAFPICCRVAGRQ